MNPRKEFLSTYHHKETGKEIWVKPLGMGRYKTYCPETGETNLTTTTLLRKSFKNDKKATIKNCAKYTQLNIKG